MASTTQYRSVLVPLDGSAFAEQALPIAIEIAQAARARVRLVLVHQTASVLSDRRDTGDLSTKARLAALKAERGYLRQVAARVKEVTGTKVTGVTLHGPIAATLGEHIDLTGADLVVMTTHGRGMLERAWLGSVADALLRTVKVPMLLVRPRKEAPPAAGFKSVDPAMNITPFVTPRMKLRLTWRAASSISTCLVEPLISFGMDSAPAGPRRFS